MKIDPVRVQEGVAEGVYMWMKEHDVTSEYAFLGGVEKAVAKWLDGHGEDVIAAAVEKVLAARKAAP